MFRNKKNTSFILKQPINLKYMKRRRRHSGHWISKPHA